MNSIRVILIIFLSFLNLNSFCYGMEKIFYILRDPGQKALASLKNHYQTINILISQAYQVDGNGVVWGSVGPYILNFAKTHSIKLMALITNQGFDPVQINRFLSNPDAQKRALNTILTACNKYHYYGVQFDFESISINDRDKLTHFFQQAAQALHQHKFAVSYAVVPTTKGGVQPSAYQKRVYENWAAAYDLKSLGSSSDFITVMAYNQHQEGTTPGPTASIPWVEAIIKHTLKYIPPAKISLGIPTYSTYWFTTNIDPGHVPEKIAMQENNIGYNEVEQLLQQFHVNLLWDETDKVHYAMFEHNWLNQYLFIEDAKSFAEEIKLVEKYKLDGISVFRLGLEDPKIWVILGRKLSSREDKEL